MILGVPFKEFALDLVLKPIGFFESCFKDKFAIPRQPGLAPHAWGKINFESFVQPELSLDGLQGYSHLWLVFAFHQNSNQRYHAKVHPPRLEGKTMGALATRSPHRPNNIGLSLVKIYKVLSDSVIVMGADLLDGTPIYDVKPYLPAIESIPDARDGWSGQAPDPKLAVEFSETTRILVDTCSQEIEYPFLKDLIVEVLSRDPRPQAYKATDYKEIHIFRLFKWDVHFSVDDEQKKILVRNLVRYVK